MPRRALIVAVVCLLVPATAHAAFFPGTALDGPSPAVQSLGNVDLARDGSGALVYVRQDDGVNHVYAARFSGGLFQAPERIDGGLAGASSTPVVAAADGGRLVIVFVNDGLVYGVVHPAGGAFSPPTALAPGGAPAVDISINGTAFASFTFAGDVRVVRLDRRSDTFTLLPQPVDVDPANVAGEGTGRSSVSVSADGVGIVAWGEAGHVFARKVFNTGLSDAPQDLTPGDVQGFAATTSDLPDVQAEDDSSYAWVTFRQQFAVGGSRLLARRQRGTTFDPPVVVDPGDEEVDSPRLALNGRGEGLAAMAGVLTRQPIVSALERDAFGPAARIGAIGVAGPAPAPAISENGQGLVAYVQGAAGDPAIVRVRPFSVGVPQPEATLSRPDLGGVDASRGFDAAVDRAGSGVVAWIQAPADQPDQRSLVAGYLDRPPLAFAGQTSQHCCRPPQVTLSWQAAFELWGAPRYRVAVDGVVVGETTSTKLTLPRSLTGALHRWQVTATDVRGQTRRSPSRLLRIDDLAPRVSVGVRRKKRVVTVSVRGTDPNPAGHRASGLSSLRLTWGEPAPAVRGQFLLRAVHRYRNNGSYTIVVRARDKAGNERSVTRSVRIGR